MAGFVAMISVFLVVCVEMFFATKGAGHVHGSEYTHLLDSKEPEDSNGSYALAAQDMSNETSYVEETGENADDSMLSSEGTVSSPGRQQQVTEVFDSAKEGTELDELDPYTNGRNSRDDDRGLHHRPVAPPGHSHQQDRHHHHHPHVMVGEQEWPFQNPQRQLLQCMLLEAGILFHSIFIGMAVSVATGTSFVVLLVAICFHQTFEGFALGSRIASLIPNLFAPSSIRPWLMSLAYGTTTPIGQAIGLIIHNLYDPASSAGLIMVGITNAISSGLLLFAGLVELLAEDFLSDSSYQVLRGRRRIEACLAVACGAILMALVGAFA